ncbi:hypothetical protein [Nocardia sp. CY41]|uniref:hypothetical protein n=1 Tax=Nocardia sp. CY41 TaxID=2608686 RepID=UPI00135AB4CF|nr:hypothetical protein [Nocardia sp. CY41]
MSKPRPAVDPAMQAWIDEQMKHFPQGSMAPAVQMLVAFERSDCDRAAAAQKGAAA